METNEKLISFESLIESQGLTVDNIDLKIVNYNSIIKKLFQMDENGDAKGTFDDIRQAARMLENLANLCEIRELWRNQTSEVVD